MKQRKTISFFFQEIYLISLSNSLSKQMQVIWKRSGAIDFEWQPFLTKKFRDEYFWKTVKKDSKNWKKLCPPTFLQVSFKQLYESWICRKFCTVVELQLYSLGFSYSVKRLWTSTQNLRALKIHGLRTFRLIRFFFGAMFRPAHWVIESKLRSLAAKYKCCAKRLTNSICLIRIILKFMVILEEKDIRHPWRYCVRQRNHWEDGLRTFHPEDTSPQVRFTPRKFHPTS